MRERGIASFVVIGTAIVLALTPSIVLAQPPAPQPAPAQPAPAQPAKPPEPPHIFSGTLTAGISLESGQTDLKRRSSRCRASGLTPGMARSR